MTHILLKRWFVDKKEFLESGRFLRRFEAEVLVCRIDLAKFGRHSLDDFRNVQLIPC